MKHRQASAFRGHTPETAALGREAPGRDLRLRRIECREARG